MTQEKIKVTPMRAHKMPQNFSLYAIHRVAGGADDEQFTIALPFDITDGVRIEDISSSLRKGTFDFIKGRMGSDLAAKLESVQYALVHRYEPKPFLDEEGNWKGEEIFNQESAKLVYNIAACMRLIRPMRQSAQLMQGAVREDGTFDVQRFDHPLEFHEVPEVQKFFGIRNSDAEELRSRAPGFLHAMGGDFWKFRMAVDFHEAGHFQPWQRKARYILWCCAIESLFTSHNLDHQGSLVAKERIKWLLGEKTSIYAPGDISTLLPQPDVSVGEVLNDLYKVRNFIAHGDRIPDSSFSTPRRQTFGDSVVEFEVLLEAASFIIRSTLLKILREGLLVHFADAAAAEAYFGKAGLTKSKLKKLKKSS
ncbi:MAG: hypothetical protein WCA49_04195 [Candidatus Sulfotelmatobacter sp.]